MISDGASTGPYAFGYPRSCSLCADIAGPKLALQVAPFLEGGTGPRVMLIGQDPTIRRDPERVKHVLMLDEERSQLRQWLKTLFGESNFERMQLYATNVVKCSFQNPPSTDRRGGFRFLEPYFENCKRYLYAEIVAYKPDLALTFGEPAHRHFCGVLDDRSPVPDKMKDAFSGQFFRVRVNGMAFRYSPSLHIKTFRVAETYGQSVSAFKEGLEAFFQEHRND